MIARFLANALALAAATWLVSGISVTSPTTEGKIVTILVVALIFGAVNSVIKPLFQFSTAPLILLTLGLFLLVINALLLMLTAWFAGVFNLGWQVDGFWSAFFGAVIVSFVSFIVNSFLDSKGVDIR